jgi:predicted enzyme related to lactoylglutathione lyase
MAGQRTYPHGVPCWIDTEQSDLAAARRFYGGLFGWTFEDAVPADAPGTYLIAKLDGHDVAGIGPGDSSPAWHTYVAVEDADATATGVVAAGGTVVAEPHDAGPGGRAATCVDPEGAAFRLWQPRRRPGAQLVNAPGSWNFSNLRTNEPKAALAFYSAVFGWVADDMGAGAEAMLRVTGYGDHLARTVDPDIYQRQAKAPPGFADAIGALEPAGAGEAPHWSVKFTVADRDDCAATAERLGASVLSAVQTPWTREALVRDPQGAEFSVSQFTPPDW